MYNMFCFSKKPVDIWSCGIIMYELVNMGKHPFFDGKEPREMFFEKLKNPVWQFSDRFTRLKRIHELFSILLPLINKLYDFIFSVCQRIFF